MRNCKHKCGRFVLLAIVGVAVAGWVVMALWNWLAPDLFGWKTIGYWQALGLLVLSKILFGGFRGHCGRGHCHGEAAAKLAEMSPEERERFKTGLRSRWCGCGGASEQATGNAESPR
jgi:hypothetical protein